jgi:hypothetical protein
VARSDLREVTKLRAVLYEEPPELGRERCCGCSGSNTTLSVS